MKHWPLAGIPYVSCVRPFLNGLHALCQLWGGCKNRFPRLLQFAFSVSDRLVSLAPSPRYSGL
jgi:hypothetical protein